MSYKVRLWILITVAVMFVSAVIIFILRAVYMMILVGALLGGFSLPVPTEIHETVAWGLLCAGMLFVVRHFYRQRRAARIHH